MIEFERGVVAASVIQQLVDDSRSADGDQDVTATPSTVIISPLDDARDSRQRRRSRAISEAAESHFRLRVSSVVWGFVSAFVRRQKSTLFIDGFLLAYCQDEDCRFDKEGAAAGTKAYNATTNFERDNFRDNATSTRKIHSSYKHANTIRKIRVELIIEYRECECPAVQLFQFPRQQRLFRGTDVYQEPSDSSLESSLDATLVEPSLELSVCRSIGLCRCRRKSRPLGSEPQSSGSQTPSPGLAAGRDTEILSSALHGEPASRSNRDELAFSDSFSWEGPGTQVWQGW